MAKNKSGEVSLPKGKVRLGNKLAFACGDIFGGGSFNIINFLFTPFLTLVVGIPMVHLTWMLLLTKIWDGIIDPFIGKITDAKNPGKFGKRRWFMLICAAPVLVGLVLLFFPWNLITDSTALKCVFVVIVYMLYATAQSFVLIPYYSHASEMTDDFNERNKTNAVRLAFSIVSSTICVAVPGMIASPEKAAKDGGICYIIMAAIFGVIFMASILVAAIFSKEQIVTPAVKSKFSFKEFVRPLKVKTYRQYLGMQMCTSMAMAMMSSFFFTLCDFYLRSESYRLVTTDGISRFPIATVAAALMFVAQAVALPFYLKLVKVRSKRFAYLTGAFIWMGVAAICMFLPGESGTPILNDAGNIKSIASGTPDWALMIIGLALGFGIGGTVFVPHSSFGDVCDVGELYFGERTEGAFSGITNFLNTTAQAIGLAIPPLVIGLAGYVETDYVSLSKFSEMSGIAVDKLTNGVSGVYETFKYTVGNGNVQLLPLSQSTGAQWAIRICFAVLPIIIMAIGCVIAFRYKLTKDLQQKIVEANARADKDTEDFAKTREELLSQL
ncbi:MAG: MFS transporter [Corallococcus sp.]|nr:MFS transporter [Corallococcus sp.]MCM1359024.1 MFS transporter [Corallococcus sp.]MCM1395013.1 MFS transporter [Corallococcus sp.]